MYSVQTLQEGEMERGREDEERGVRKRRRGGGEREGRIKVRPHGLMHVYGLTLVLKIQTARI